MKEAMAVQGVMHTSNPIHDYEFSWTIENFSYSPDVLRGPPFSPLPGFLENVCLELQYAYNEFKTQKTLYGYYHTLDVSLINLNVKDGLVVSGHTTIRDTNDKTFREAQSLDTKFQRSINLLKYASSTDRFKRLGKIRLSERLKLSEDKLVVKGKLSISGYDIASSVSSLIVKEKSEACGEVLQDFKTLYESGSSCDVIFSVGEKTLRAHKIILLSRSPVFAKMFESDMLESNSNNVVIEDADFHAFNRFLMFLYTGIVEDKKWNTVLSLYYLAHKYQVKSLHAVCSRILINTLSTDSVCKSLVLSDLHGEKELKNVAKAFIRHHILQIAGTAEWIELVTTKPQLVKEVLA